MHYILVAKRIMYPWRFTSFSIILLQYATGAACSVVVKLMDLDPQGWWFLSHDKICTAVGPLSKALNPTLLQSICLLFSLINCKSLWTKASAKSHVMTCNVMLYCSLHSHMIIPDQPQFASFPVLCVTNLRRSNKVTVTFSVDPRRLHGNRAVVTPVIVTVM